MYQLASKAKHFGKVTSKVQKSHKNTLHKKLAIGNLSARNGKQSEKLA